MSLTTYVHFLFSSAFFPLTIFIFALEYFHRLFGFFFLLVLRLVVWRGVVGFQWCLVLEYFGYKGLEAKLSSAPVGNTQLGTPLNSQELFD